MLGEIPEFRLTERAGTPFGSRELDGQVWVAGFIFTRCPDVCPAVTGEMRHLRTSLDETGTAATLVSISVDPAYDTPERLAAYASTHRAEGAWYFVTGERATIARLLRDGFRVAFADDGAVTNPITHSDRLVLVDGARQIRGYYHGRTRADVDRLLADARRLAAG